MAEVKVMSPKEFMEMEKIKKEVKRGSEESKKKKIKLKEKPKPLKIKEIKKEGKVEVPLEDLIEMRCYIKYNLYYGQPKAKIKQALIEQGWTPQEIERQFLKIKKPANYVMKKILPKKARMLTRGAPQRIPIQPTAPAEGSIPMGQAEVEEEIEVPLPPQARRQ